jgi:hypothetical protein
MANPVRYKNLRSSKVPVSHHLSQNLIKCHCAAVCTGRNHPDESQILDCYSGLEPPNSSTVQRDLEISNMKSKRDCIVLYGEESRSAHANDVLAKLGVLWIDLCLFVSMFKSMRLCCPRSSNAPSQCLRTPSMQMCPMSVPVTPYPCKQTEVRLFLVRK